jgi:CheY-like chemotaxis protein
LFDDLLNASADSTISGGVSTSREQELVWVKQSFPCETVDVASLIAAVLHRAAPMLRSAQVQVECSMPEHRPPITGQLTPMRQALLNLLTAAAHATAEGKILVTVQTGEYGIDVSVQAGSGPVVPSAAGQISETLGMARQLAELCGCTLAVAPTRSGERAFAATLRLPLAVQKPVLVIDDNVDAQRLFERYVAGTCYRCVGIRAPEEAVTMAVQVEPCAILLDVMLPGIDGWELLERLREHPALARVPVIVCTILPDEEMALTLGAAGFLRKPVTRQALLSALDRALAVAPGSH